ncbi:MAG: competence/damage-inducible protein A [Blastocatellia bacterium]|nr:competence/damage-inducible protein A [Blastocatellia bacterium]
MKEVAILAIGNELLLGETQDSNTYWLCQQLTKMSAKVIRAVMLPDEINFISEELKKLCTEKVSLIITSGGLGATEDDITLQAIAVATGVELQLNSVAYEMVYKKLEELAQAGRINSSDMTESRKKMALLPVGSTPLENSVGTAPGVSLRYEESLIVALPGVPSELKAIFTGFFKEERLKFFGAYSERDVVVACGDESMLAPILSAVATIHPMVYIKSKAKDFVEEKFLIKLHARAEEQKVVNRLLDEAELTLIEKLKEVGIGLYQKS